MTAAGPESAPPQADHSASTPRVILVVEDDARVRQVVADTLSDEGWMVVTAEDGARAIAEAARQPPALVVLDLSLPVADGYTVAATLRSTYGQDLPILVLSADGQVVVKAQRVAAYAYLRKPFDLDALIAAVRQGLGED